MPEQSAKIHLHNLAKRLKKPRERLTKLLSVDGLNEEQRQLVKDANESAKKIDELTQQLDGEILTLSQLTVKMGADGCLENGTTTANKHIKLKSYPGDEHIEAAKAEFDLIASIEPVKNKIASDIGVSRQFVHVMYAKGYATPQFAERLSRNEKYSSIDKRKLRPDVKESDWDKLLVGV